MRTVIRASQAITELNFTYRLYINTDTVGVVTGYREKIQFYLVRSILNKTCFVVTDIGHLINAII